MFYWVVSCEACEHVYTCSGMGVRLAFCFCVAYRSVVVAMASMIDSEAFFASRCERAGLPKPVVEKLRELGWATYATFAFCVLDQNDEKAWETKIIQPVLGADLTHAARLRRMFLEAYTHTVADLKRQTEITELDAPRRLPPQELDARLAVLQAKILPLKIQGRLEPSHHLINSVCQMVDDQRIRYIALVSLRHEGAGNQQCS